MNAAPVNSQLFDVNSIDWTHAAPDPTALVLLDWVKNDKVAGTEICQRDVSGSLHGCRTVSFGAGYDNVIAAWIRNEVTEKKLTLADYRLARIAPPATVDAGEILRQIQDVAMLNHADCKTLMIARLNEIADLAAKGMRGAAR